MIDKILFVILYIKYQSILESLFHLPSVNTLEYIINIELIQSFLCDKNLSCSFYIELIQYIIYVLSAQPY